MRAGMLAFILGVLALHLAVELPEADWRLGLLALSACLFWRRLRWLGALSLGLWWAASFAAQGLEHRLPADLEGRDLAVVGRIDSIPAGDYRRQRFVFAVQAWEDLPPGPLPSRLSLSWYESDLRLVAGDRWRLTVRLKRPYGLRNPGSFDAERWAFSQGLGAVGYVRAAEHLEEGASLHRLRQAIRDRMLSAMHGAPAAGVVVALAVGDYSAISRAQWDVFAATGTGHLVSISGLHVALVALAVGLLAGWAWRRSPRLCLRWPARQAAASFGLLAALVYAALAGFGLPTQRAVIMLAVVAGALLARRTAQPWHTLLLALAAVLLWDPLAPLSPGLWLSFGAVAVILAVTLGPSKQRLRWVRLQLAISLALIPLTILWFQQAALIGPLANALAIPWVSFLVVPAALGGALLQWLVPPLGALCLQAGEWLMRLLFGVLEYLAQPEWQLQVIPAPALWTLLLAAVAVLLALAPAGVGGRWLSVPLLLPLLLRVPERPPPGEAWLTALDVGQGLAVVVQTARHVLVFDTGPRLGPERDAGAGVVLPFLRSQGWGQVDHLMISHSDNDHSGGTHSVRAGARIVRVSLGEPLRGVEEGVPCREGQGWEWDGVSFQVLAPVRAGLRDNDASCVLRIESGAARALLTGDIGREIEAELIGRGADLRADLLIAPHHGSETSSSEAFIRAVAPREVVYSVGYRNRWGFPRPGVIARYDAAGARGWRTDRTGALRFRLTPAGLDSADAYRALARRYYHVEPDK